MNDYQMTEDGIFSRFTLHWKATDGYKFYVTDQNGQRFMDGKPKKSKRKDEPPILCFFQDSNRESIGELIMIPAERGFSFEIRDVSGGTPQV